jgi:hypothetical protein
MEMIVFSVTLLIVNYSWAYTAQKKDERIESERNDWKQERQQLLDRIQAGSFAEYKTQEVRVLKAQVIEKEAPRLEQL